MALTLLLIAGGIFAFINSFTGNPISAALADRKIRQYAAGTYPSMDLSLSPAVYSIKANGYISHAQSATSQDTQFTLQYSRGRVTDDYAYEVTNHFTTYRRLSEDFDRRVTALIEKEYPHRTTMVLGDLQGDTQPLTPDAPLDLDNMPMDLHLVVYVLSEKRDAAQMAARLLELHRLLLSQGIAIDTYTLRLEEPLPQESKPGSGDNLYLEDFPSTAITEDLNALQEAILAHQQAIADKDNPKDRP